MITKTEATKLQLLYNFKLSERADNALRANASVGVVGATISYADVPAAEATRVKTEAEGAGWTVVVDGATKTAVLS